MKWLTEDSQIKATIVSISPPWKNIGALRISNAYQPLSITRAQLISLSASKQKPFHRNVRGSWR